MHEWISRQRLEDHYNKHGRYLRTRTIEEYVASALDTIARGTIFGYDDPRSGERRIGCFDRATGRFTAITDDDRYIVSHFRSDEAYVIGLPDSAGGQMNDHDVRATGEGDALFELHRRLIKVHHGLATAGPEDAHREADALEGLHDALLFIAEQPSFLATREARQRVARALR